MPIGHFVDGAVNNMFRCKMHNPANQIRQRSFIQIKEGQMVAQRSTRMGFLSGLLPNSKPSKPTAKGNAAAFKAGAKSFNANNGATPDLRRVVRLSLENDTRSKK
jgi:hypothetical protein